MKIYPIFIILFTLLASCSLIYDIADKQDVQKKIEAGALIIDVRTPKEYAAAHYKGAVNIPLAELPHRLAEISGKDRPIVVYCRTGNRSNRARKFLLNQGYSGVINGGGLEDMLKISITP